MQSPRKEESSTSLQDGGSEAEEESEAAAAEVLTEDTAPHPHPENSLDAVHAVQENVAEVSLSPHNSHLNTSVDMQEQEPGEEEEEEEEEEFLIFNPEHPVARRQQAALSRHFSQQLKKINLDIKEKLAAEKADAGHIDAIGVEVFRKQELLVRLHNRMEDRHQIKAEVEAKHRRFQDQQEAAKRQHYSKTSQGSEAQTIVSQLQAELDSVMLQLVYTQEVSEHLWSEVKAVNTIRCKARVEKSQAGQQKHKQDLYLERLTQDMERLRQQIAMCDVQGGAQAEETQAAKEVLTEAEMELESLLLGRKQLLQQWNSSLLGMRRRDEALGAIQEAVRAAEHQATLLDKEAESYKKSIIAEEDQFETVHMQLNLSEMDAASTKKLLGQKQAQHEALQSHFSTCLRMLRETERTLATLTKEANIQQTELAVRKRQLEKESSVHLEVEDKIIAHMQQNLTYNKAAECSQRLTSKMASLKKEKMCKLQRLENEVLAVRMESLQIEQHMDSLILAQEALDEEIAKYNESLTLTESKISSLIKLIKQRQAAVINCHAKISQITARTGQEDLSPLQIKAQAVLTEIQAVAADIKSSQQLWMKRQGILVGLTQEMQANSREILKLETEFTIMHQKKVRLERQMRSENRDETELEKNSKTLKTELLKLNTLMSKNSELRQALQQENALMETDFCLRLKEAERGCIKMQMRHEKTQEEKERLLNSLLEAERQIMLWERKIQLFKETRSAVDSEVDQGEIRTMKREIHRMEVRLGHLMKQQEQLLRESEAVVAQRETIALRRDATLGTRHKRTTRGELNLCIHGLQRRIQETHKQVAETQQEIRELQGSTASLSDRLKQQKQQLMEMCSSNYIMSSHSADLQDTKDMNLAYLVTLQSRSKRLLGACAGRYQPSTTAKSVEDAMQSQAQRVNTISTILDQVCKEFPQHQGALRKLSRALAVKIR
ncbi:coiled-coil domain-containing protein 40 [Parambassis ranga]|uniref:Coiled-coil domain-containing protein 40 n=1 Tax=Parambassis ranga TaxID=210632 RepID=A0A6P7JKZ8_9TELE|nr:coiled-coil domain-containing protein 40-like [Parambassis ranga]